MVGLKVNAKERRVGSRSDMLRDGNVFLLARWLKSSKFSSSLASDKRFLYVYVVSLYVLKGGVCFNILHIEESIPPFSCYIGPEFESLFLFIDI